MATYRDFLPLLAASYATETGDISPGIFESAVASAFNAAVTQVETNSRLHTERVSIPVISGQQFIDIPQMDRYVTLGISAIEASPGNELLLYGVSYDDRGIRLPCPASVDGELVVTLEVASKMSATEHDDEFVNRYSTLILAALKYQLSSMAGRKWYDAQAYDIAIKTFYSELGSAVSGHMVNLEPTGMGDYTAIMRVLADIALKDDVKSSTICRFKENVRGIFRYAMQRVIALMGDYTEKVTIDVHKGVDFYPLRWYGDKEQEIIRYSLHPDVEDLGVTSDVDGLSFAKTPSKDVDAAVEIELAVVPGIEQDVYDAGYVRKHLQVITEQAKSFLFSQTNRPWHSIVRADAAEKKALELMSAMKTPKRGPIEIRHKGITSGNTKRV